GSSGAEGGVRGGRAEAQPESRARPVTGSKMTRWARLPVKGRRITIAFALSVAVMLAGLGVFVYLRRQRFAQHHRCGPALTRGTARLRHSAQGLERRSVSPAA